MSIRIRKLRLSVMTKNGRFGRDLTFPDGLNILRVGNASGKSTCIQAIVYALGLESMMSPKHTVPLPHSMSNFLEFGDDKKIPVLESEVFLVVENKEGELLTLRRQAKGEADNRLVTVWHDDTLTKTKKEVEGFDYYVRLPNSAKNTRGFHRFLARFIGWSLPDVTKNDGSTAKLYLECIFPLAIVEQKRGWSGIQMAIPLQYGIKNVRQRAIEFVLDLDAQDFFLKRAEIDNEKEELRHKWNGMLEDLKSRAAQVGGEIRNYPISPTSIWPPEVTPTTFFSLGKDVVSLQSHLRHERELLSFLEQEAIPQVEADAERITKSLDEEKTNLREVEFAASSLEKELYEIVAETGLMERRASAVSNTLREYKDIKRLQKMGSSSAVVLDSEICPTCAQNIEDSLLPQSDDLQPLGLDENIKYLENQRSTILAMIENGKNRSKQISNSLDRIRERATSIRQAIRHLKATLISDARIPSEAAIAEKIQKKHLVHSLNSVMDFSEQAAQTFDELASQWGDVLKRQENLPKGYLSDNDKKKLNELGDSLKILLSRFGLRSLDPAEFNISLDSYHPTYEQFDLGFDLAASDVIRLVWAYLLGLMKVDENHETNHPGVLVLDEPQQQNVSAKSVEAFIEEAKSCKSIGHQVILAASTIPDSIFRAKDINILDIDGWVLQPMKK